MKISYVHVVSRVFRSRPNETWNEVIQACARRLPGYVQSGELSLGVQC